MALPNGKVDIMFRRAQGVYLCSPFRRVYRELTITLFQIQFDVISYILEQFHPVLKGNILDRVVQQGVVNRAAVILMAIIVDNAPGRVIAFRHRTTWYRVKRVGQEVGHHRARLTWTANHTAQRNFVLKALATF